MVAFDYAAAPGQAWRPELPNEAAAKRCPLLYATFITDRPAHGKKG